MVKLNTTTPSGFPEFSLAEQRVIQHWKKVITEIFEKHGFPLLETPLVERAENFTAKGGNPKEIYILDRLLREESHDQDKGQRAIRFDHTVPLALFVSRHFNELTFPFRRSVIGPVMRGERAQKGRFRQFDQCDIDTIGSENLSLANDAQMAMIIAEIFSKLMPKQDFVIRINNRKILTGLFAHFQKPSAEFKKILEFIDNLEKNPNSKLEGSAINFQEKILEFIEIKGENDKILQKLVKFCDNSEFQEGVSELREVINLLRIMKLDEKKFTIDLAIARGLDYYTGTVYETNLVGYEKLGSVCSGGRYDDLAGIFTGKKLPGVGISIGLTRLLWQLFEAQIVMPRKKSSADGVVLFRSPDLLPKALEIGRILRENGFRVENYLEQKKIKKQFSYANKEEIPICIIVGESDIQLEVSTDDPEINDLKLRIEKFI